MSEGRHDPERGSRIEPAAFRRPATGRARRRRHLREGPVLLVGLLGLFVLSAWFLFGTRALRLHITPEPDVVAVEGGLSLPLAGRYLVRPGRYTVVAEKAGYRRLSEPIEVTAKQDNPTFSFRLTALPGRLAVRSEPPGAVVVIDGKAVGRTPLEPVSLAPGAHAVLVRAKRYQTYQADVAIEGKDVAQTLEVKLTPAWAPVTFRSEPAGATVVVDGEEGGITPLTAEIGAGTHQVALRLAGYRPWEHQLTVAANKPRNLPIVRLVPAEGTLRVTSEPTGANVVVADEFRGRTPVTVSLAPNRTMTIRVAKAGYEPAAREVRLAPEEDRTLALTLAPILGTIEVHATPADATLYVDGQARGSADQTLSLTAVPHVLELRKPGFIDHRAAVTPKPGFPQQVRVRLQTEAEARATAIPPVIHSSAKQRLNLVQTGHFLMGSPRREQGRRANEDQRPVKLTRAFYLGAREVTNAEFRQFRPRHSSGIVRDVSLDNDNHPVVRVSWDDAARYCNWLSQRDGLPSAYREGPQGLELVTPANTGYRLPTEAEWEWAARFAGDRDLKYPWGQSMPPTGKAGNYADVAAAELVPQRLDSYNDGHPATAPVASFPANALGLYDLGGNVSEWMNDRYGIGPQPSTPEALDPLGPASGSARVTRGASWRHGRISELRLSYRDSASGPRDDLGFRLARYAQ